MPAIAPARIGSQIPNIYVKKDYSRTKADVAIRFLNEAAGMYFDPWQELILRDWLALDDDGLWAHMDCGLVVARQEGKSELIIARLIVALYLDKIELAIYSSHRIDSSVKIFKRMCDIIEASPKLMALTKKTRTRRGEPPQVGHRTVGREAIETLAGSRVEFRTRKADGGRGFTADLLVLDEAMVLPHEFAGDVRPTLGALPNPQIIIAGSAGNRKSEHFGALRNEALSSDPGDMCWHEWSVEVCDEYCDDTCDEHADPWDEDTWYLTNPSLGIKRKNGKGKTLRFLRNERKKQGDEFFLREYMSIGTWPSELDEYAIIPKEPWETANRPDITIQGRPIFAVAITPDRMQSCIVAVGYADDSKHNVSFEITGTPEIMDHRAGTRWLVPRLVELYKKHSAYAIVIDAKGHGSTVIEDLKDVGGMKIISPLPHDYAVYCGKLKVGITGSKTDPRYIYHRGQKELTSAVAGLDTRKLSSLTAWARATDASVIISLEAATIGLWGLEQEAKEAGKRKVWFATPSSLLAEEEAA